MEFFHTQLTAARKAKRLTQEQLSELMNVSRPTVSRWENGHVLPDIETVKRLTELLEFDFVAGHTLESDTEEALSPVWTPPEENAPDISPEGPVAPRKKRRLLPFIALCALLMLALCLLLWPKQKQAMPTYPLSWYLEEQQNTNKDQAFLRIFSEENPLYARPVEWFEAGAGWLYTICMTEENGVALTIDGMMLTYFHQNGECRTDMIDFRQTFFGGNVAQHGIRYHHQGGFPLQDIIAIGVLVTGTDADGNALVFHGCLELSREMAP